MAVAAHLGEWRGHLFEGGDGLLGIELLIESNGGVEHHDGKDGDGIQSLAEQCGDHASPDQQPNDETFELAEKHPQRSDARAFLQLIRPIRRQAIRRLFAGKPGLSRPKFGQRVLG